MRYAATRLMGRLLSHLVSRTWIDDAQRYTNHSKESLLRSTPSTHGCNVWSSTNCRSIELNQTELKWIGNDDLVDLVMEWYPSVGTTDDDKSNDECQRETTRHREPGKSGHISCNATTPIGRNTEGQDDAARRRSTHYPSSIHPQPSNPNHPTPTQSIGSTRQQRFQIDNTKDRRARQIRSGLHRRHDSGSCKSGWDR